MEDGNDLCRLTLVEVARLIKGGEVSPVEVTRACLERTERLNPTLNAAIRVLSDQALEAARRAEREVAGGHYRGPLHGVPVGIKDLVDYAGVPTTAGSHLFDDRIPSTDAVLVRQLKEAGAVITAKLNCDEFAYHPTGATSRYGPSRNPWNPDIVSGGSSSGTAVAVATGMVYAGLGTDTGGSIRMPAAACGLVGVKPTYGRVSLRGVTLLSPSFDTPGPLARTTLDAALMLQGMVDPASEDTVRESNRMVHLTSELEAGLEGLRMGVPSTYFFDGNDEEINTIVRGAIDSFPMLGAEVVAVDIPSIEDMVASHIGILTIEAFLSIVEGTGGELTKVNPTLQQRLQTGLAQAVRPDESLPVALGRLRAMRDDAMASYRRALGAIDVLVTPALRRPPPPLADALEDYHWMPELTRPFNCSHQPVACVPCGWTEAGLPVGLQIVATKYRERTALRVAHAYETSELAPERRWPPTPQAAA